MIPRCVRKPEGVILLVFAAAVFLLAVFGIIGAINATMLP